MPAAFSRHLATLPQSRWGARQVHYLRSGSGPALLLLHQSPLSCWDYTPLVQQWSEHFTVIAPDNPGFGLSDPFGVDQVSSDEIGHATVEFLDALGIDRIGVYGVHTGAKIAATLSVRYPERVTAAVANGYSVRTADERADYLAHYLPAYPPVWDGSHLTAIWSRLRQTGFFFPWHHSDPSHRVSIEAPPLALLTRWLIEHLRSGDHYRVGYRTAFTADTEELLAAAKSPMLVTASSEDILSTHLARIGAVSSCVAVDRRVRSTAQTLAGALEFLRQHPAPTPPPAVATQPIRDRFYQRMAAVQGGHLLLKLNASGAGAPIVVLHDAASSTDRMNRLMTALGLERHVIGMDLPGHGESDEIHSGHDSLIERYAQSVLEAISDLGLTEFDVFGFGLGGCVGLEMTRQENTRIKHLTIAEQPAFAASERAAWLLQAMPTIVPNPHGGHIAQAWHFWRERDFYTREAIETPVPTPETLTRAVLDMLRAPERWPGVLRAYAQYPLQERLRERATSVELAARIPGPWGTRTQQAAQQYRLSFRALPGDVLK